MTIILPLRAFFRSPPGLNPIANDMEPSTPGNRSVSCVADTSSQREVVVECFAPYDDHRYDYKS